MKRGLKIAGIVIVVLIVIILIIPLFVNANAFRPRLESELTDTLGRQVKVGNLSLSIYSGSVKADNISIADDPAYSKAPFVQARSLSVGVQMIPLIFSKSLQITDLTLDNPEINLIRSENGEKWNFSSLGNKGPEHPANSTEAKPAESPAQKAAGQNKPVESKPVAPAPQRSAEQPASSPTSSTPNISISKLAVNNGRLTVTTQGMNEPPRVYSNVNIGVNNFSFASAFPFTVSADLPGGGTLHLNGNAGPIDAGNAEQTPLDAKVQIQNMNLAESGFIDPAAGISGIAGFDGNVSSNGHVAKTNGTLRATKLQVVKKGSPAGQPVQLQYAVNYNLATQAGDLTQGNVAMGKAVAHLTGTYDAHGKTTSVNMKLDGQNMPVDDLESMLPAVGVVLPPGATLKGGALNINFTIVGPVDNLVTAGNFKLQNSSLAGFNLGQRLSAISALSGKTSGNITSIQNFSGDVRMSPQGTQAQNIDLVLPAIGTLTGAGTVSPTNALDFKMLAGLSGTTITSATKLIGLGSGGGSIPFLIQGTTSDPKFMPDVKGMARGFLKQLEGGKGNKSNPLSGFEGLFKKPK